MGASGSPMSAMIDCTIMFIGIDSVNHQLDRIFGEQFWMAFLVIKRNIVELTRIAIQFNFAIRIGVGCQIERTETVESDSREDSAKWSVHPSQILVPLTSDLDVSLIVENRHLAELFGAYKFRDICR